MSNVSLTAAQRIRMNFHRGQTYKDGVLQEILSSLDRGSAPIIIYTHNRTFYPDIMICYGRDKLQAECRAWSTCKPLTPSHMENRVLPRFEWGHMHSIGQCHDFIILDNYLVGPSERVNELLEQNNIEIHTYPAFLDHIRWLIREGFFY